MVSDEEDRDNEGHEETDGDDDAEEHGAVRCAGGVVVGASGPAAVQKLSVW